MVLGGLPGRGNGRNAKLFLGAPVPARPSKEKRTLVKRSFVLRLNVLALSTFFAMLAILLALWTTEAAEAHTNDYSSVDCSGGPCEIRYGSASRYGDAVSHSIAVWNQLGKVRIAPDKVSTNQDVTIFDTEDRCNVTWVGYYVNYSGGIVDTIRFNVCNFRQSEYSAFARAGTATHEMGHALGLAHSYSPNILHTPSRETGNNTPQSHDRSDYFSLWG